MINFKRIRINFFAAIITAGALTLSCNTNPLPRNSWEAGTYKALNELITGYGSASKEYNADCKPYAVFDFDNTTIIGDIELTSMAYQLENLRLAIAPENMYGSLIDGIEDIDKPLNLQDSPGLTIRMLAEDIASDYKYLYDNYISRTSGSAPEIREGLFKEIAGTPEYQDFKAKAWALSAGVYQNYDYGLSCMWLLRLYNGMTKEQQSALVKEAAAQAFGIKAPFIDTWTSPDMGKSGRVSIQLMRGLGLSKEMQSLYKTLKDNGFDVYICSASEENILESVACDPQFGLGHNPDYAYGIRLKKTADGIIDAEFDTTYTQTYKEGKTKAIIRYISPEHCGQEPILVAGDSNGDYAMLTQFKSLKIGLIINCLNGGGIGELTENALEDKSVTPLKERTTPMYLVQGRNAARRTFIPTWETVPLEINNHIL